MSLEFGAGYHIITFEKSDFPSVSIDINFLNYEGSMFYHLTKNISIGASLRFYSLLSGQVRVDVGVFQFDDEVSSASRTDIGYFHFRYRLLKRIIVGLSYESFSGTIALSNLQDYQTQFSGEELRLFAAYQFF